VALAATLFFVAEKIKNISPIRNILQYYSPFVQAAIMRPNASFNISLISLA
jgi:hypothetical protein